MILTLGRVSMSANVMLDAFGLEDERDAANFRPGMPFRLCVAIGHEFYSPRTGVAHVKRTIGGTVYIEGGMLAAQIPAALAGDYIVSGDDLITDATPEQLSGEWRRLRAAYADLLAENVRLRRELNVLRSR